MRTWRNAAIVLFVLTTMASISSAAPLVRSARSGPWSDAGTWSGGVVPQPGGRVYIEPTNTVTFDVQTTGPLVSVQVAGTLTFATDRDTRLDVGALLVRPGDPVDELAPAIDQMVARPADAPTPRLEIGTVDQPIAAGHHAVVRLHALDGQPSNDLPAFVVAGGEVQIHRTPLAASWLKLAASAVPGNSRVTLDASPVGWTVGDHVIVVATHQPKMFQQGRLIPSVREQTQTEERTITTIDGASITLDSPLKFEHTVHGDFRGEVADLSHNVVIEAAEPAGVRGHTMFHHGTSGSVAYAEFRHLGKRGTLARYAMHFHQCGPSMRGFSVVGCSIWDSENRFITLHDTQSIVLRDNVGYQCVGHGFFLEDGSETDNILDRNLAVQALKGAPLPNQGLAFDFNDGAGFWWANCQNTFTRNVAAECDQYGFRYEAVSTATNPCVFPIHQPDGCVAERDVRTLPFVRFAQNEAHSQRRYAVNLGGFRLVAGDDAYKSDGSGHLEPSKTLVGDVGGVGPDLSHPFVVKDFRVWRSEWAFHTAAPSVIVDGLNVWDSSYGIWRSRSDHLVVRNTSMAQMAIADVFNNWGGSAAFDADYNKSPKAIDDRPPQSIITRIATLPNGQLSVTGVATDDGLVASVIVNGVAATSVRGDFCEWTVTLPIDAQMRPIVSVAADRARHDEPRH